MYAGFLRLAPPSGRDWRNLYPRRRAGRAKNSAPPRAWLQRKSSVVLDSCSCQHYVPRWVLSWGSAACSRCSGCCFWTPFQLSNHDRGTLCILPPATHPGITVRMLERFTCLFCTVSSKDDIPHTQGVGDVHVDCSLRNNPGISELLHKGEDGRVGCFAGDFAHR